MIRFLENILSTELYRINMVNKNRKELIRVSDISTDKANAEKLIALCNGECLYPRTYL